MSGSSQASARPSSEFDFALSGYAQKKSSDSTAIKVVHVLRDMADASLAPVPEHRVSQFLSTDYVKSKLAAELHGAQGADYSGISAEQTMNSAMVTQEPPSMVRSFVTTMKTDIPTSDLGRPIARPGLSSELTKNGSAPAAEHCPDVEFAAGETNGRALTAAFGVDDAAATFEVDPALEVAPALEADTALEADPALEADTVVNARVKEMEHSRVTGHGIPDTLAVPPEAQVAAHSNVEEHGPVADLTTRINAMPPGPPPAVNAVPAPVGKLSETPESRTAVSGLRERHEVSQPAQKEGSGSRRRSGFALLAVGLVTLVATVGFCIFLILNIASDQSSRQSSAAAAVADFVPPDAPVVVPGVIQAEDYDTGGPGVSYNDSDETNSGGVYRTDGVDIAATPDQELKLSVVDTADGEWLVYSFTVNTNDSFVISTGVGSSTEQSGAVNVLVDGDRVGTFYAQQSDAGDFSKQVIGEVDLEPGTHQLRFEWFGDGGVSVDWIEISLA